MTLDPSQDINPILVFDRRLLAKRRLRTQQSFAQADFLYKTVFEEMSARLKDVNRTFDNALAISGHPGAYLETLTNHAKISTLTKASTIPWLANHTDMTIDEEALPFASDSFDLVFTCLNLHWINDVPGTLLQLRQILKPDGLLLGSLYGGRTLQELRDCLMHAELDLTGGVSPRVSPFTTVQDYGMLLQRAGFALPVIDSHTYTVYYPDIFKLMQELRQMGETNVVYKQNKTLTRRELFFKAGELYQQKYETPDGLPVTMDVIYLSAWTPHSSQQKPLRPGSAEARLAEALETKEHAAGDKTDIKKK